ncbi:MAG: nucleotide exchange factor GrpE [Chloroflexi bacterium]|nr:nucleotide exchange factor GrpE [Chloroflexota bacterium]
MAEEAEKKEGTAAGPVQEAPSLEEVKAQLEESNREKGQYKALAQRAQADLANFRRRVEEERAELYHSVAARLISKLLPVLDDLQRALDQVPASAEEARWLEGVRLIERSLRSLLESEGVTPIEADGKAFDPWEHEALFAIEDGEKAAGTVVSTIRPGYKLRGRVLRAAQVAVAQGPGVEAQQPPNIAKSNNDQEREV